MIHHINAGMSLAETMYLFPHIFPPMQAALVEAGEKSGNLKTVLSQIVEELESHQDFMRKIKGAMFYPVILIVLALTMVAGMMIFVIPKVAELYKQSNATLPTLTQKVIGISEFVSTKYPIILGGLFTVLLILWLFVKKTKLGKLMWEKFVSIIPVFGLINKQKNIMIFASNLGMLLQSGVLISDAFEITEKTMGNLHYRRALGEIRHGIILGKNVSEMMGLEDIKAQKFKENKLFPLQVAQMIHIGELTGAISRMLMKIRENYHKNIDYTLKNMSTMIEPIMIFIVAVLVGSILLAVMLPFFYIGTTIS
jgi:type II secretory pathway component PulF